MTPSFYGLATHGLAASAALATQCWCGDAGLGLAACVATARDACEAEARVVCYGPDVPTNPEPARVDCGCTVACETP